MIDLATTTKRTLRVDECMEVFGVSRRMIYYWIEQGRLSLIDSSLRGFRINVESARALAATRTPPGVLVVVQELHD